MDRNCLLGEEMCFSRSDIDVVLPALEDATKRKFNSSFTAEQRRFESLEKQIRREKEDVSHRLSLEKKYFLRSNLVLKDRRELSSRRTGRNTEKELEKPSEETRIPVESKEKLPTRIFEERTQLERSPYYFPPLYKNVEKGLREIQTETQLQMDLAKKEKQIDTETIRNCRYLRLSSTQERATIENEKPRPFVSEFEENSSAKFYDNWTVLKSKYFLFRFKSLYLIWDFYLFFKITTQILSWLWAVLIWQQRVMFTDKMKINW